MKIVPIRTQFFTSKREKGQKSEMIIRRANLRISNCIFICFTGKMSNLMPSNHMQSIKKTPGDDFKKKLKTSYFRPFLGRIFPKSQEPNFPRKPLFTFLDLMILNFHGNQPTIGMESQV